jgi:hypothetical protein
MSKLAVNRSYRDNGRAPLYLRYERQANPQPAYLELTEDGQVIVDSKGEIGNAMPVSVWHQRDLRWPVPHDLTPAGIDQMLDAVLPLLEELYDHHTVGWDGSNFVGSLDERGRELSEEIDRLVHEDYERANIYDACEWANSAWHELVADYREAKDREAYLERLEEEAEEDGVVLVNIGKLEQALDREIEE